MKLPQRTYQHNLEEVSNRFFKNSLPKNWVTTKPTNDYGIDEILHIFDGSDATPYQLNVQLKSSLKATKGEFEKVKLKISTYNYLIHQLHISILIKYVEEVNKAYWILLVDIPKPNQKNHSFTISLQKKNQLSTKNWTEIENWVRTVVDFKLDVGESLKINRFHKK